MTSDPLARYQAQRGARGGAVERLTSSEVVDAALRVYQRQGLTFLRLTALPSVFCLAAIAFVLSYVLPGLGSTTDPNSIATQAGELLLTMGLGVFVGGPVFLTGLTYASAIVVHLTADALEGREPNELEALKSARIALPRLFWLNLRELLLSMSGILVATAFLLAGSFLTMVTANDSALAGVVAMFGMIGLFAGVFIFLAIATRHALAVPVAVIERTTGKDSARRSKQLLKPAQAHGSAFGTIYSVYFLLFFIGIAFLGAVEFGMMVLAVPERVGSWLAGSWVKPVVIQMIELTPLYLVIWALIPAWAATLTVVYYERRVRLEGYDIEALGKQTNEDRASRFNV
ncbi:MAG: hypothetical protein ACAH95_09705 [Fimbriimonas sp.]